MRTFLNYLNQFFMPLFGALYFVLAGTWNLPEAYVVMGGLLVLNTVLGFILYLWKTKYDGGLIVDELNDSYKLELNMGPEHLANQRQIVFKVVHKSE